MSWLSTTLLRDKSLCLILLMCDVLLMIQTFWSIISPSFLLLSSFLHFCALYDTNWSDHLLLLATVQWWGMWLDGKVVNLCLQKGLNSDMKRLWRHIAHKAGFYTPCRHTAKQAFKHFYPQLSHSSPAPHPLNTHLVEQHLALLRDTLFSFFVCSWLTICLEINSLPEFPGQTKWGLKKLVKRDKDQRRESKN